MKKLIFIICISIGFASAVFAQNLNGRFSSSVYSFQRYDTVDVSNNYLRSFQMLNLNLNKGKFSLRTYMNLEGDLATKMTNDPRLRFYNLFLEVRNIADLVTLKLGRQPLFNSVAGGVFDGLNVDVKKGDYKFTAYYGGNVPAYQKLELTNDFSKDFVLGGKFSTVALKNFQISLSYINKNFKPESYMATRLDANLNPIQVLISNKSNQYQFASAAVDYYLKKYIAVNTRFDYDLNYNIASKFEFDGTYDHIKNLKLRLYYNYRAPRIRYNSIFSVFDYGNTQEVEAGADYAMSKLFTITGRYGYVRYKDDNSQRITFGVNSNYGSVTFRKTLGYAGELSSVSFYTAHSFMQGLLTPSIGLAYTEYKLSPDADVNTLSSLLAGVNVRPWRIISFDLQAQYMNNKIYRDDLRFFLKLNYWFNTNF